MRNLELFSAVAVVLVVSVAGCGTEVVSGEGDDEGRSGVTGDDGDDGDGGEDADGEGGETGQGGDGRSGGGGEGGTVDVGPCDPANIPAGLECCPGMTESCFTDEEDLEEFGDMQRGCADDGTWEEYACDTPLVLSFDRREPVLVATNASVAFDLAGDVDGIVTDWPRAETPWLVLDRDGDGRIADGRELFGSGTVLATGARAQHGFEALAELDADGNGVLDAADPGFATLALWSDHDANRASDAGELQSIAQGARRLVAIDLGYRVDARCDARGNCGVERASFRWEDESGMHDGEVVDVHLRRR